MAFDLRNRFARAGAELLVDETGLAPRCLFLVYDTVCLGSHQPNSPGTEPDRKKVRSRFRVKSLHLQLPIVLHTFCYHGGPAEFTAPKADSINRSIGSELVVSLVRCVRQVRNNEKVHGALPPDANLCISLHPSAVLTIMALIAERASFYWFQFGHGRRGG